MLRDGQVCETWKTPTLCWKTSEIVAQMKRLGEVGQERCMWFWAHHTVERSWEIFGETSGSHCKMRWKQIDPEVYSGVASSMVHKDNLPGIDGTVTGEKNRPSSGLARTSACCRSGFLPIGPSCHLPTPAKRRWAQSSQFLIDGPDWLIFVSNGRLLQVIPVSPLFAFVILGSWATMPRARSAIQESDTPLRMPPC